MGVLDEAKEDGEITREEVQEALKEHTVAKVHDATIGSTENWSLLTQRAKDWINDSVIVESSGTIADAVGDAVGSAGSQVAGAIKGWVRKFVWDIVVPIFKGFYIIPLVLVGVIAFVFLGGDRALKETVEGFPGLADIPVLVATWIIQATAPIGDAILATAWTINVNLVNAVTHQTGIAAAPLLVLLQSVELGVLAYLLWAGFQAAGAVPIVGPVIEAGTEIVGRPFKAIVGWFR